MKPQDLHPRTLVINKKQKNHSKLARIEALQWLATMFPAAFDNSSIIRPLKRGIMVDILAYADKAAEDGISKSKLREAVVLFTRRMDYLACLKARECRVDLQGVPGEQVSEEEAAKAALKIKRRVENSLKLEQQAVSPSVKSENKEIYSENFLAYEKPAQVAPTVSIKHKAAKAYDPEAVARLKEKLGLVKKADVTS